jgi:hypothetical protein
MSDQVTETNAFGAALGVFRIGDAEERAIIASPAV